MIPNLVWNEMQDVRVDLSLIFSNLFGRWMEILGLMWEVTSSKVF